MIKNLFLVICIGFAQTAAADDAKNHEFLYGYLSGVYHVVGKEPDSDRTYSGKVIFRGSADHLVVTRTIGGERITGIGTIEHALGPDAVNVLRVRFTRAGREYEITYLWQNDLDNYARLSGYVYQPKKPTALPGFEALFIDPTVK